MKASIKQFADQLGADLVGFAPIADYDSPRSPNPGSTLQGVQSMVVLGYREIGGSLESENTRTGMAARMGCMELMFKDGYMLARYLEDRHDARAALVPPSYPLEMGPDVLGLTGDVSLRHAAVAAGLGVLGRHNLLIHPRLGSRVVFAAVLTDLTLEPDPGAVQVSTASCGRLAR